MVGKDYMSIKREEQRRQAEFERKADKAFTYAFFALLGGFVALFLSNL